MKIEVLKNNPIRINDESQVVYKEANQKVEIKYTIKNTGGYIRKIDKDHYYNIKDGEVKKFNHKAKTRKDTINSLKRTMAKIKELIDINCTEPKKVQFITFTFREVVRDTKVVYDSFKKFNYRYKRYLKKHNLPSEYSYIVVLEAQGPKHDYCWHLHCLYIFKNCKKAPYVPNDTLQNNIWKLGYTKISSLKCIKSISNYLVSYLTDVCLDEEDMKKLTGKKGDKAIIKGQRLKYYPKGVRIYRTSRDIVRPTITKMTEAEAQRKLGDNSILTYEKTLRISNYENTTLNIVNYRHYDKLEKKKK